MENIDIQSVEDVVRYVLNDNCMLFLGSGFSAGATNILNKPIPIGKGLSSLLDEQTGEDNGGDLEEAADSFIEHFGEVRLAQVLRETFTVKETSKSQLCVCKCNWRRIYTTNYDNLVETIKAKDEKSFLPVTLSSDAQSYVNKRNIVVHLNGSINDLSHGTLSSELKLTSSSYLTQQFQSSSWMNIFQYDIRDSDLIVFIGFSLQFDLDIKKILWEEGETKKKCVFILSEKESAQRIKKVSRYGVVFPIGLDAFAQKIEEIKRTRPVAVTKLERPLLCFKTPSILKESVAKIPDASVTDLLLFGKVDELLLQKSSQYPTILKYYINRKEINEVLTQLQNGGKEVLIHSDLGNGKTLFIRGLVLRLLNEGYKVYEYNKYYVSFTDEVERICSQEDSKIVIIVENYYTNKSIIETIQSFRTVQRLIVTERSVTNDMSYDWLRNKVKKEFSEVDINRLDDTEVEACASLLDHFGLWRKYSTLRDDEKIEFLKRKCNRSMKLILLEVIKSMDIQSRIKVELNKIRPDTDLYQAMVLMLVSNLLNWNINLDDISYALGNTIRGNAAFHRNPVIKEYVDFSNSELKVKSSILSEVILTHIMDVNIVRETLVKAFRSFNKMLGNKEYQKYMVSIMSYANLQRVFNKEEGDVFNNNIVVLFEDIRRCSFCEKNPHYWLQYAIAKLGEQKFDEAKIYFDNAYTFAKRKSGFDTYQIDNHYARYLLENVIYTDDCDEYFKAFRQAHTILTDKSHIKDTKFYPFKVARAYLPFYQKFKTRMTKKERQIFLLACEEIDRMVKSYKNAIPRYRIKREVRDAEENISKIFSELSN